MYTTRNKYEPAPEYGGDAYQVNGWSGIAFAIWGWETEPDNNTEWSGYENRTGNLIAVMIGDDRKFSIEPSDVSPIADTEYCHTCGQIGCGHSLRDELA